MADRAEFEASFNSAVEAAKQLEAAFLRDAEIARAVGDETLAAQLKFTASATQGPTRAPESIAAANSELTRENVLKQRGVQLDLEMLDAVRAQVRARAEEVALSQELQRTSLIVPRERRYTSFEQTAGAQSAREAQQRIEQEIADKIARENALLAEQRALEDQILARRTEASAAGYAAGQRGRQVSPDARAALMAPPAGMAANWTAATQAQIRYDTALGNYVGFADRADLATQRLQGNTLRLGIAEAEASNELRRHGALTSEFISALARGETTMAELGYQVGATIGKFAGWTVAATATYGALAAVAEFGKGAIDSASGVQQLTRTIDGLDRDKAAQALSGLSQAVNVPIKEAADATFLYSRTFHDLADAVTGAKDALSVFKLDNVAVNDSMQLSTLIFQQFGRNAQQQQVQWDMLAAGQREYNARISQTVPLLRNASGAVRASGGDLNQLIQLAVLATRVYPGQGSNIGTAFARGAATYTPKNLADLQTRFGLGYGSQATNWTELLQQAILKSGTMSGADRRKLAADIFDPRFGSRLAGIFGPQAAATLRQEIGGGRQAITPAATRGSLQEELQKELGTFRERVHSFVNEMQRFGSALGASGILNIFSELISGAVKVGSAFRGVIDGFDALPNTAKEILEVATALKVLSLIATRTRFGSSIPLVTRVPGFRPSEDTQLRRTYAQGNRAVIQQIEQDIARTDAQLLTSGTEQAALKQQILATAREAGGTDNLTTAQLETINAQNARIVALGERQVSLEAERAAQLAAVEQAQQRQVGLTAINRSRRYTPEQMTALKADVEASGPAVATRGAESEAAAMRADEAAQLSLFETMQIRNAAITADAAAGLRIAEEMTAGAAETEALVASTEEETVALTGFRARAMGLVAAMDPLLVGMLAFPFVFGAISDATKQAGDASKAAETAINAPVNNLSDLQRASERLQRAAEKQKQSHISGGPLGIFQNSAMGWGDILGIPSLERLGGDQAGALKSALRSSSLKDLGDFWKNAEGVFTRDATNLAGTQKGREKVYSISQQIKQAMGRQLASSGLPQDEINRIYAAFTTALQNDYNSAIALRAGRAKGSDFLNLLDRETTKDLSKSVQGYSDRADIYGLGGTDLSKLGQTYLFLAARFRSSNDQAGLQLVKQAQQALVTAVNKNVQDLTKASESETTFGGQMSGLNAAAGVITGMHARVQQWVATMDEHFKNYPKIVKAVNDAARQIDAQLNDNLKQVLDQQLQLMKTQSDLTASGIQGVSPEADIARAQSSLDGLRQELAKARSEGADWQTIAGLETQINTAATALLKQRIDNARGLLDAQGTLAVAQITGIGPSADIQRAQAELSKAQQLLSFDQSHGAGQKAVLTDQAAVFDAQRSLNEQIQQRDQQMAQDLAAFIQAEGALAEARTTDPVAQARDELRTAIRVLSTIKPTDYKTYQEYQTAVLQQQATIAKDRQSVTQQIADTDMRNLRFELDTQRITDQQYIDGLRQILKLKHLSAQERQTVLSEIFSATHQAAVDLNVGNIKMPTTYEVRAAIRRAMAHPRGGVESGGATMVQTNNTVTNHISVTAVMRREGDVKPVTDAVVKAVTQVWGQAQAAGAI